MLHCFADDFPDGSSFLENQWQEEFLLSVQDLFGTIDNWMSRFGVRMI